MMMVMKRARHTDETSTGEGRGEGNSEHINVSEQWQLRTG